MKLNCRSEGKFRGSLIASDGSIPLLSLNEVPRSSRFTRAKHALFPLSLFLSPLTLRRFPLLAEEGKIAFRSVSLKQQAKKVVKSWLSLDSVADT